jgi:nicotinate-nucleotide adenylyltransferase
MLKLAVDGDGLFDICQIELGRTGPSYTLDTLDALRGQMGASARLHWVIGADMLEDLPRWHRAGEVLKQARILIAARPPWQERIDGVLSGLVGAFGEETVRRLRESVVPTPLIDISSTDIRRRVRAGASISDLVPDPVRRYIEQHGLYRQGNPVPAANHCRHPHGDS